MTTRANVSQPSQPSRSGATSVTLSPDLVNALTTLGVQASGFGSSQIQNGVANFLITGGAADLDDTKVDILHSGGLAFRAGNTTVNLTDFEISNLGASPVLTGLVTVNGTLLSRTRLFNLQIGGVNSANQNGVANLDLQNVATTLTPEAATALNQAFNVTAFRQGLNVGTAQVDAFVNPTTSDVEGISSPSVQSEPTGVTNVTLSPSLVTALTALNVQATGFGGTEIRSGVADFKITGGAADLRTNKVDILHSGGLTFTSGNTRVTISDFAVSNLGNRAVLTGLVTLNGNLVSRTPLFDLQIGGVNAAAVAGRTNLTNLDLQNVALSLSPEAAAALNQAFNVTAFQPGLAIGTAQVDAFVNTATGDVEGTNPLRVVDVTGTNQLVFTGASDSTINALNSRGGNRIYGGETGDVFRLGTGDLVWGGSGDDRFYVQTGGNNQLTGGEGADQFWIVNNGQAPANPNTITDFQAGSDVLGLEGLVTSFGQLRLRQRGEDTLISANGRQLAILTDVRANRLTANNFTIVGLDQNGEPDSLTNVVGTTAPTFAQRARNVINVTGRNQEVEGTQRNDLIDIRNDQGRNEITADRGNDTLILGNRDQVEGDRGNDRFYAGIGGNNRLTGGRGADQFWISEGEIPTAINTITDFDERDVIGIAGLGVTQFDQITLTRRGGSTLVSVNGDSLVLLQGVRANSLAAADFTFG